MNKRIFRRSIVAVAILGAFALNGTALAIDDEMEPNNPAPQVLSGPGNLSIVTGGKTIRGAIDRPGVPDIDFFSFYAREGDILNFVIESKSSVSGLFIPTLAVISATAPHAVLRESVSFDLTKNPIIENFVVPENPGTGIYVVGVSGFPCKLLTGGVCPPNTKVMTPTNGSYTLAIVPAIPQAMVVTIDVKPGSGDTAPFNLKSRGNVPVALITTDKFKPLQEVDLTTVKFGATGTEVSARKCDANGVDVSGDGKLDMVCHFPVEATGFTEESREGVLTATLKGGGTIEGRAPLKINLPKRDR